jgi:hypothetical protein
VEDDDRETIGTKNLSEVDERRMSRWTNVGGTAWRIDCLAERSREAATFLARLAVLLHVGRAAPRSLLLPKSQKLADNERELHWTRRRLGAAGVNRQMGPTRRGVVFSREVQSWS